MRSETLQFPETTSQSGGFGNAREGFSRILDIGDWIGLTVGAGFATWGALTSNPVWIKTGAIVAAWSLAGLTLINPIIGGRPK